MKRKYKISETLMVGDQQREGRRGCRPAAPPLPDAEASLPLSAAFCEGPGPWPTGLSTACPRGQPWAAAV